MFSRLMKKTLRFYAHFPVIAILGPRQSGKTTLVQMTFGKHTFVSLENPLIREFAINDPERFLKNYANEHGLIIDEFQYAPQLLSYIQLDVDAHKRNSYYILTGSQNFLINQAITQSLAGRVGILHLLPLSIAELVKNKLLPNDPAELVFNGSYPRLYAEQFVPEVLYPSYIQTYVERDVRQIINVGDLATFQKFVQLCAARIGNLLNLAELATVCGISATTAKRWIALLEASFIIFLLEPHYHNFNKRLTKMPKLYFYDTGLACSLLRISSAKTLPLNPAWGSLFECLIVADLAKQYLNRGSRPPLYFWRDQNGRLEVDCIVDEGGKLFPIEIKASENVTRTLFSGLSQWNELARPKDTVTFLEHSTFLVYAPVTQEKRKVQRSEGIVVPWNHVGTLTESIEKLVATNS